MKTLKTHLAKNKKNNIDYRKLYHDAVKEKNLYINALKSIMNHIKVATFTLGNDIN